MDADLDTDTRDDLIDTYFEAMDAGDPGVAEPVLADGFVYESLGGRLEGVDGFRSYFEGRTLSNTTHEIATRVHGADASVAEGTVTGEGPDGPVSVDYCDVFEFDEAGAAISRIAVYKNDS